MPTFKIIPSDGVATATELPAEDVAYVFSLLEKLGCTKADLIRDDGCSFTISLDQGLWYITRHANQGAMTVKAPLWHPSDHATLQ